ncbi:OmpA family protein [Flavobacterium okayamense]|uniref:OmpA family protein n=1 Tax=Flavobacterium okayamense TaxID=2830782 RepID=UPI001C8514AF|nr:OmpA family protein [Flavobacterium okayamense]
MKTKFLLLLLLSCFTVLGQDIDNAQDHELLTRYPESKIIYYFQKDYNELKFAVKSGKPEKEPQKWLEVSGHQTSIVYEIPLGKSTVEVMKNYQDAFKANNAEILFQCKGGECDGTNAWYSAKFFEKVYGKDNRQSNGEISHYYDFGNYHVSQRYMVGKITTADKVYYVEIGMTPTYDGKPVKVCVEVIEQEALQSGLITLNADVIKDKLEKEGKLILDGILFDTSKATLQPTSFSVIEMVGDYLNQNPKVRVYIVGHTDDIGSLDSNLQLSEDRAGAVVSALMNNYGDFGTRLTPIGVGPACPVATNETEDGRMKNRRVEIVLKKK